MGGRLYKRAGEFVITLDPSKIKLTIPTIVTMVQARLALNQLNLLEPVEIAISTLPRAAQIEWEFRATVQRDSGLVQALAVGLGLTEQMLDELFTLAATF